ncbi:hypothetical protein BH09BAC1_BH09BAC1_16400 [soil metagenome]
MTQPSQTAPLNGAVEIKVKTLGLSIKTVVAFVLFCMFLYNLLMGEELYNFKADVAVTIIALLLSLFNGYLWWYNFRKVEILLTPKGMHFFGSDVQWDEVIEVNTTRENRSVYLNLTIQKAISSETTVLRDDVGHLNASPTRIVELINQYKTRFTQQ